MRLVRSVEEMLAVDGTYVVASPFAVFVVEVVGDHIHQIDPGTGERDGTLPRDGWVTGIPVRCIGPFNQRKPS
jgi:hypothetical protein